MYRRRAWWAWKAVSCAERNGLSSEKDSGIGIGSILLSAVKVRFKLILIRWPEADALQKKLKSKDKFWSDTILKIGFNQVKKMGQHDAVLIRGRDLAACRRGVRRCALDSFSQMPGPGIRSSEQADKHMSLRQGIFNSNCTPTDKKAVPKPEKL